MSEVAGRSPAPSAARVDGASPPRSRNPDKDAIVTFASGITGGITTVVYTAVRQAIDSGELRATLPDKVTLYRWLRDHRDATAPSADPDPPPAAGAGPRDDTSGSDLDGVALIARAAVAEAHLHAIDRLVGGHTPTPDLERRRKHLLKDLGRARGGLWDPRRTYVLLAEVDALVGQYEFVAAELGIALPKVDGAAGKAARLGAGQAPLATPPPGAGIVPNVAVVPNAAVTKPPGSTAPNTLPIYVDPLAPPTPEGDRWGVLLAREPRPAYGFEIGHVKAKKSAVDAGARALMIAPVRTGEMSVTACAAWWRDAFAGRGAQGGAPPALRLIAPEQRKRWAKLSTRTLQRWNEEVERERGLARAAGDDTVVDVVGALTHVQTTRRSPRKATPDVVAKALELFTTHEDWSKAVVAQHMREHLKIDISDRLVQQILAEELSDRDRAEARGGAAADEVMFRRRLFREAKYPNRAWIMDHSFLRHDVHIPEHLGKVKDVDFEFDYAVRRGGTRHRRRGLYLTLIMDAATRRVLKVRVWDRAPDTRMTLLVLREAMAEFGVPDILYTDNGSDLNSAAVRDVLAAAGVHHVNSMPYTPQGRGKIERLFRTIKQKVLQTLPGYYGGRHGHVWGDDDLIELAEVEELIWDGIERLLNRQRHSETKRVPETHYNDEVGARRLRGVGPALASPDGLVKLLLVETEVLNRSEGFRFLGRRYYCPDLGDVPNGAELIVYFDPAHLEVVHVSVVGPGGSITYLGPAEYYDADHPPPGFEEQRQAEASWARESAARVETRRAAAAEVRRLTSYHAEGEVLGVAAAEAVAAGRQLASGSSEVKLLSAGTPPAKAVTPAPPHDGAAGTAVANIVGATPAPSGDPGVVLPPAGSDLGLQRSSEPVIEDAVARSPLGAARVDQPVGAVATSSGASAGPRTRRAAREPLVIKMPWED